MWHWVLTNLYTSDHHNLGKNIAITSTVHNFRQSAFVATETTDLLSVTIHEIFFFFCGLNKWNCTVCILLCQTSFVQRGIFGSSLLFRVSIIYFFWIAFCYAILIGTWNVFVEWIHIWYSKYTRFRAKWPQHECFFHRLMCIGKLLNLSEAFFFSKMEVILLTLNSWSIKVSYVNICKANIKLL